MEANKVIFNLKMDGLNEYRKKIREIDRAHKKIKKLCDEANKIKVTMRFEEVKESEQ